MTPPALLARRLAPGIVDLQLKPMAAGPYPARR